MLVARSSLPRGGLALLAALLLASVPAAAEPATWYRDVLPVVQARCQGCHVAGGIAPFPLVSPEDGAIRHALILNAVSTRYMPPWMPSDDCRPLQGSRRLEEREIEVFRAWSTSGAPAGDPGDAPPPAPPTTPALEWTDVTLDAGAAYLPAAAGTHTSHGADDYRCFVLDPGLAEDRDVVGFEVEPGVRRQVHHVLLFASDMAEARAADAREPGLGWTCFGGPNTGSLAGFSVVGGWVPGSGASRYPEDTGITLRARSAIVMQVHYNLAAGAEPDRTRVKLQFGRQRVRKPAVLLPLADLNFTIPPGAQGYTSTMRVSLPLAATVWGVAPHMHLLGRRIRVETDAACLVDVPSWKFHWQQSYLFTEPLALAPGARLTLSCTWDNPTAQVVRWGEGTADEMCLAFLYTTF